MNEIVQISSEQSLGIFQVEGAVKLMDSATQNNAALVEESSAAADSLNEQASNLLKLASVFTLASPSHDGRLLTS